MQQSDEINKRTKLQEELQSHELELGRLMQNDEELNKVITLTQQGQTMIELLDPRDFVEIKSNNFPLDIILECFAFLFQIIYTDHTEELTWTYMRKNLFLDELTHRIHALQVEDLTSSQLQALEGANKLSIEAARNSSKLIWRLLIWLKSIHAVRDTPIYQLKTIIAQKTKELAAH